MRTDLGKPEGKIPLGRPWRRWEDIIKMDLQEVSWEHGLDRSGSGWGKVAGNSECGSGLPGSKNAGNFLNS